MSRDNSSYSADASQTDIGASLLTRNVGTDSQRGTITLFGHEYSVGRQGALLLKGAIDYTKSMVSQYGAQYARMGAESAARAVRAPGHLAIRAGNIAAGAWSFGVPGMDVALNIHKAASNAFTRMRSLNEEADAVMLANKESGDIMGSNIVLCNERKAIMRESRKMVLSSFVSVVENLPNVVVSILQQKKELIKDPGREMRGLSPDVQQKDPDRWRKAMDKKADLEAMGGKGPNPKPSAELPDGDPVSNTWRRLFHPGNLDDLNKNIGMLQNAPIVTGLVGQMLSDNIEHSVDSKATAWRLIKQMEDDMKTQSLSSKGIRDEVRAIFQQHVRDCDKNHILKGPQFDHVVQQVTDSLAIYKLNPQGLAEVLADKKIIDLTDKKLSYGNTAQVKKELTAITDKYQKVNAAEFFRKEDYAPKGAVKVLEYFGQMRKQDPSQDYEAEFVAMYPEGYLEAAGADKEQVRAARERIPADYNNILIDAVGAVIAKGRDELAGKGVSGDLYDQLQIIWDDMKSSVRNNDGGKKEYMQSDLGDMTGLLRKMAVTAKDKDSFCDAYLRKRAEAENQAYR